MNQNQHIYRVTKHLQQANSGYTRLFLIFLISTNTCLAQPDNSIIGKVIDSKTKEPIPFATVFLANTLIGTRASYEGNYNLQKIALGTYELTASSVGYKLTSKLITIVTGENKLNIELQSEVKILKEITVKSNQSDYLRQLKIFKQYFLGETRNALKCVITNIGDVELNYDEENKILTAVCEQPLVIENQALGYRIFYFLKEFTLDSKLGYCTVAGTPRFEPLIPKNQNQLFKWERERQRSFNGSLNHFMRSLKYSCLYENNFSVNFLQKTSKFDQNIFPESEKINDTLYSVIPIDESALFHKAFKEQCFLKIVYSGEHQEVNYNRTKGANLMPQTSYLKFKKHALIIYDNGYYEDPLSYHLDGYLGWSTKAAELIPLEYQPNMSLSYSAITEDFEKEEIDQDTAKSIKVDSIDSKPSLTGLSSITGIIMDGISNKPLLNAEVFLSNTLLSSKSSANGIYRLEEIPNGMYDLVVAAPGYTFVKNSLLLNGVDERLDWKLEKSPLIKDKLIEKPSSELRIFKFFFNGRTGNSKKCFVRNIEGIHFQHEAETGIIKAVSAVPIEVENKALGYLVTCYLKKFTYDFRKRTYTVDGVTHLEELKPASKAQAKYWQHERVRAYNGSFSHFMDCLNKHSLKENLFLLYRLENNAEIPTDEAYIYIRIVPIFHYI